MKLIKAYRKYFSVLSLFSLLMSCELKEKIIFEGEESSTSKEDTLRTQIIEFGKDYLDTPYKAAGKKPSTGFDCSGFTGYVYREFGIHLSASSSGQATDGEKIAPEHIQPADLLIFADKGRINHVGMVVDVTEEGIYVLHSTSRGVVIDNVSASNYWRPRILYGRQVLRTGA